MSVPSSHFRFSFLLIITSIKKLSMKIGRVWKYFFGNIFLCWHFCVNGFFFFAKIIQQKWYKNESLWNLLVFMNFINKIPLCAYKNCYWRGNLFVFRIFAKIQLSFCEFFRDKYVLLSDFTYKKFMKFIKYEKLEFYKNYFKK